MDNAQCYVADSLELHLFFARIMKEHAFFLKAGFLPPDAGLAAEGERLLRQFEALLSRAISLSDHAVGNAVLHSGEVVTPFTAAAECQTQRFTGIHIDRSLTAREARLSGTEEQGRACGSRELTGAVRRLNRSALALVDRLIAFKEELLRRVGECSLFTTNYPLLIEHILREARLYRAHLRRLEGLGSDSAGELRDSELFWNRIMMEHALFIRGLLDPGEEELVNAADGFAADYRQLLESSAAANDRMLRSSSLALTEKFRDFKRAGVEGIENCRIRSIILPLLADHVLREANHYLRLLGTV